MTEAANVREHPLSGATFSWALYQGFDVDPAADFTVHTEVGGPEHGAVESSHTYDGDIPNTCLDECYEDPSCHGFVTYEGTCFFRGGNAESAEQLVEHRITCNGCNLYVLDGTHNVSPSPPKPPPPLPPYAPGERPAMEPFPIFWVVVPLLLVVIAAGAYAYDMFKPKKVLNQVTELKLEDNEVIQEVEELPEALPKKQTLRGYAWSSAKSMGAWALGYGEEADPDKVDETPNTNKVMV